MHRRSATRLPPARLWTFGVVGSTAVLAVSWVSAAAKRDSGRLFDMHDLLCPAEGCATDHAGQPVYDDTGHLGVTGRNGSGACCSPHSGRR